MNDIVNALSLSDKIVIYGAHLVAYQTAMWIINSGMKNKILGFAVTNKEGNPKEICELPVKELREYSYGSCSEIAVIVAVPKRFFEEITGVLSAYGYENIYYADERTICELINTKAVELLGSQFPEFNARIDKYEYLSILMDLDNHSMRFMPFAAYPSSISSECLNDLLSEKNLWHKCGNPIELGDISGDDTVTDIDLKIYLASSERDVKISKKNLLCSWEIPVLGGASAAKGNNKLTECDNCGENISDLNRYYAEMTVSYWAWKNSTADYIGLEHYRRRFMLSEKQIAYIVNNNIDVVLTRPRIMLPSLKECFLGLTVLDNEDFDLLSEWLECEYSLKNINKYLEGKILYPNNMLIAKKSVYDEYCNWIFGILFGIDNDSRFAKLRKKNRYNAYIAELLTSFYFIENKDIYRIAATDYRLLS